MRGRTDLGEHAGRDCHCEPKGEAVAKPEQHHGAHRPRVVEHQTHSHLQQRPPNYQPPSTVTVRQHAAAQRTHQNSSVENARQHFDGVWCGAWEGSANDGIEEGAENQFHAVIHVDEAEHEKGPELELSESDP